MIDFHTHILPNIDNGSRNIEETFNLIKEAQKAGFEGIVLTSHYKEGYYESIVITIGNGEGNNWWCFLFPNLCLVDLQNKTDIEYKSWLVKQINKIF